MSKPDRLQAAELLCVYLKQRTLNECLLSYGEAFNEKPKVSESIHLIGKISDQLSSPKFFQKYGPKVIICLDGPLPYLLKSYVKKKKYFSILADLRSESLPKRKFRLIPNLKMSELNIFDFIFPENEKVASQLLQNSLEENKIKRVGLSQSSILPLPFPETNNSLHNLQGRPKWAALNIHEDEIEVVLKAHQQVLKAAYRYCLTISLSDPKFEIKLQDLCNRLDLRLGILDEQKIPEEAVQVYFSRDPEDANKLMRLSPVVFSGNTLSGRDKQENPLVAASLCCGILYGVNTGVYSEEYKGLTNAGAAIQITNSNELATEINKLYLANKVADMGVAALDFISSGAEITDQIVELVFDYLNSRGLI